MRREPLYKKVGEMTSSSATNAPTAPPPASSSVIEVRDADHHAKILQNRMVVLYLYSPSCGPCKALAPRYDELANQWVSRGVTFAKENALLRLTEGIKATPTIHFYKNGALYGDLMGGDIKKIEDIVNHMVQTS